MRTYCVVALALAACGSPAAEAPTEPPEMPDQPVAVVFYNRASFVVDSVLFECSSGTAGQPANVRFDAVPGGTTRAVKAATVPLSRLVVVLKVYGQNELLVNNIYVLRNFSYPTTALVVTLSDSTGAAVATLRDQDNLLYEPKVGK